MIKLTFWQFGIITVAMIFPAFIPGYGYGRQVGIIIERYKNRKLK